MLLKEEDLATSLARNWNASLSSDLRRNMLYSLSQSLASMRRKRKTSDSAEFLAVYGLDIMMEGLDETLMEGMVSECFVVDTSW